MELPLETMASRSIGRGLAGMNKQRYDVVVVDTPPVEDAAGGVVESALGASDVAVLTLAPTVLEFERAQDFRIAAEAAGTRDVRVLLNRVVNQASSAKFVREELEGDGFQVMRTEIARLEHFAWAFGAPVKNLSGYLSAAEELV